MLNKKLQTGRSMIENFSTKCNSSRRANNTQTGRSMIEMLGVLAIMAVITVLSIMAYTMAMKNVRANNTKNDLSMISQQIRSFCPDNDYTKIGFTLGNGNSTMERQSFYNLFVKTGLMKSTNAFGKGTDASPGYGIRYGSPNGNQTSSFIVVILYLTKQECNQLANMSWQESEKINGVGVDGGSCGQGIGIPAPNNYVFYLTLH